VRVRATSRSPTCAEPWSTDRRWLARREAFGVQRLENITLQEVRGRVKAFRDLVHFSLDGEE